MDYILEYMKYIHGSWVAGVRTPAGFSTMSKPEWEMLKKREKKAKGGKVYEYKRSCKNLVG